MVLSEKTFEVIADASEEKPKCVIDHPIMLLASKLGDLHLENDNGKSGDQYYFKDLILVTDVEPCFMCAMALIHSRVSCVIFKNANTVDGSLVSNGTEIHCLKQLNHSYNVC